MNKKLFSLLIALMSLSLLGIIFVQGYWISNSYKTKDEQFSSNVKNSLLNVAAQIQSRELDDYFYIYRDMVDSIGNPEQVTVNELMYATGEDGNDEKSVFYNSILEEDFKLSTNILDTEIDSIQFKRLTNRKDRVRIKASLDGIKGNDPIITTVSRLTDFERNQFEAAFKNISGKKPIHQRVSEPEVDTLLQKELGKHGVVSPFEYAIFSRSLATKVQSDNFELDPDHTYSTPLFDALKNPKVKDNQEFLNRYLLMIRDENRRMHAQVENVLRISKLEKNELDLPKERLELHDIIEHAISHVELIVEDREGYIKTHFGALRSSVLANDSHLTNVIVNILDNAIKYSEDTPKIDVYTENVKNSIILKIRDQGMGMTKAVQKKIFEKFYREHTGDIHNVKGHGLGLAYVKRILDDHDAQIYVESEKDKGSTFIIKLHLIS